MLDRFCLNTATVKNAPLDLQIELAREAGFRQIGLWLKDVDSFIAQGKPLGEIKAQLHSSGLRVAEVCFLGGWQDAEGGRMEEVLNETHRICNVARALGSDIVVTVPALAPGWLEGAPHRFRRVCLVAEEYGVRMALEFPGIAAEVNDLRSARQLLSAAACSNAGLAIDTFHFFLGGSNLADFEPMKPGEILLVHVSDAMNLPIEMLRMPHDHRTFPGEGIIDFAPIFQHLEQLHYEGVISLEIWNRELHQSNPAEVVKKGRASLQGIEGLLNHRAPAVRKG